MESKPVSKIDQDISNRWRFTVPILREGFVGTYNLHKYHMKVNMIALKVKIAYQFSDNAKNCIGDYCHCIGNVAGNTSVPCSPCLFKMSKKLIRQSKFYYHTLYTPCFTNRVANLPVIIASSRQPSSFVLEVG